MFHVIPYVCPNEGQAFRRSLTWHYRIYMMFGRGHTDIILFHVVSLKLSHKYVVQFTPR